MKIHHTLIIIALALTSCSLNETPRSELPEDVAYTSKETLYLNTVATLYNYIGDTKKGRGCKAPSAVSMTCRLLAATKP